MPPRRHRFHLATPFRTRSTCSWLPQKTSFRCCFGDAERLSRQSIIAHVRETSPAACATRCHPSAQPIRNRLAIRLRRRRRRLFGAAAAARQQAVHRRVVKPDEAAVRRIFFLLPYRILLLQVGGAGAVVVVRLVQPVARSANSRRIAAQSPTTECRRSTPRRPAGIVFPGRDRDFRGSRRRTSRRRSRPPSRRRDWHSCPCAACRTNWPLRTSQRSASSRRCCRDLSAGAVAYPCSTTARPAFARWRAPAMSRVPPPLVGDHLSPMGRIVARCRR